MFHDDPDPLDIEILVVPDAALILVAAVIEPLRAANRILGRRQYRWAISTPSGEAAMTASGIPIPADRAFDPAAAAAPLFVVASYRAEAHATADLIHKLAAAARARPMIGGIESGSWLLGWAGLLDGHRATTHWEDLDDFAARFSEIDVRPDRFVIDRRRFTTGGASPALDLMLELIRRRQGYPLALDVSKLFIYDQSHLSAEPQRASSLGHLVLQDPRISAAVKVMAEQIDEPLSIGEIADRVGISIRRLQGLFLEILGVRPYAYYQALRLNVARRMLIESRKSAIEVAAATGFNSAGALARAYRIRYGEPPSETRRRSRAGEGV